MNKPKVIFFGNGPLATAVFSELKDNIELVFWAKTKEDLVEVERIMNEANSRQGDRKIYGILASFGVLIPRRVLDLFEPEGILNIHPSYLPDLRGPSPIETAILRGDTELGVSVMKLVPKMDAGPIYFQEKISFDKFASKAEIYEKLGRAGAEFLSKKLEHLPEPREQKGKATYSQKLDTSMSLFRPEEQTAEEMFDQVRAFMGFPKSRYEFFGRDCIILGAHVSNEQAELAIKGKDGMYLVVDLLQPAGRKIMDAKSFVNGYKR